MLLNEARRTLSKAQDGKTDAETLNLLQGLGDKEALLVTRRLHHNYLIKVNRLLEAFNDF
jgi:hypothetical protein